MVPIFKKFDTTYFINYRVTSAVLTTYKMVSNILLKWLTPCVNEITENFQYGYRSNGSITDQVFCMYHILDKNRNIMGHCVS
jgi:hypothetical protein